MKLKKKMLGRRNQSSKELREKLTYECINTLGGDNL